MAMKEKKVKLGYIHMSDYTSKSRLFSDWMFENPEYKKEVNLNPKEVILPANGEYTLIIDYPLHNAFKKTFTAGKNGMTRRQFVDLIVKSYKKIYATEDSDVGDETGNIQGMLNRETSEGRYGIWGHNLGDLILHTAYIQKNNTIEIGVDS